MGNEPRDSVGKSNRSLDCVRPVGVVGPPDAIGKGIWVDTRDTASTIVLEDIAIPRTHRRLRVVKSWTAFQYLELVQQLLEAVEVWTNLLFSPAVASLFEDSTSSLGVC